MKIFDPFSGKIVEQIIINLKVVACDGGDQLELWMTQNYICCPETFRLIYETQLEYENYEALVMLKRIIQNTELPIGHA
jgi:hypothetical protein